MSDLIPPEQQHFFVDKAKIRQLIEEVNKQNGFVPTPNASREHVRKSMREAGIRAEDNIFSCGIIAARNEE